MIINDAFSQTPSLTGTPRNREKPATDGLPEDKVLTGQQDDASWLIKNPAGGPPQETQKTIKTPPAHLSRELIARLEKNGEEAEGPFTGRQERYLHQEFARPWGDEEVFKGTPLFGLGGVMMPDSHGRIKHMAFQFGNVEFDRPLPTETACFN